MIIRVTTAWLAITCAVLSPSSIASAQEDSQGPASTWLRVDVVQVLPEELDEFLELQLERVNPALKDAGVPWRSAWLTAEFGNTYERVFATPVRSLAEYDVGGPLARSLDADRLAQLRDRIRRCLAGRQSYAVRYHPELSIEASDVRQLTLARMATIQIAPGRTAEWQTFLREQIPGLRDGGTVFAVYERMFGPGPTSWLIVENLSSFSELQRGNILEQAFGADAATVAARLAGVVLSVERTVLRYDPSLSFEIGSTVTSSER